MSVPRPARGTRVLNVARAPLGRRSEDQGSHRHRRRHGSRSEPRWAPGPRRSPAMASSSDSAVLPDHAPLENRPAKSSPRRRALRICSPIDTLAKMALKRTALARSGRGDTPNSCPSRIAGRQQGLAPPPTMNRFRVPCGCCPLVRNPAGRVTRSRGRGSQPQWFDKILTIRMVRPILHFAVRCRNTRLATSTCGDLIVRHRRAGLALIATSQGLSPDDNKESRGSIWKQPAPAKVRG